MEFVTFFWWVYSTLLVVVYLNKQILDLHPQFIGFVQVDHVSSHLINCSELHAALQCDWGLPPSNIWGVLLILTAWHESATGSRKLLMSQQRQMVSKYTPFCTSSPVGTHLTCTLSNIIYNSPVWNSLYRTLHFLKLLFFFYFFCRKKS